MSLGLQKRLQLQSRLGLDAILGGGLTRAAWSSTPTVSTFCDSWSAQQYVDGAKLITNLCNPLPWWAGLSGQTPQWVSNTGVSGERTDQWFARLPAILADSSKWVYVTTPVNDIGGAGGGGYTAVGGPYAGTAVNLTNVAQVVRANMASIISQLIAGGKTPIVVSCVGNANWPASGAQVLARNDYNAWLIPYLTQRNCVLLDARSIVTDGSLTQVTWLPGYNIAPNGVPDGVHPSVIGGYYLGKNLWQNPAFSIMQTRNVLPISTSPTQALGTNILLNPLFNPPTGGTGTPTPFTGDAPANYGWGVTGTVSGVATHSAAAVGNNIIRTETYSGTTTAETRGLQTFSSGFPTTGQIIQAAGQIDVAAGSIALTGVTLYLNIAGPNVAPQDGYALVNGGGPLPNEAFTYTALTPPYTVTATAITGMSWSFRGEYSGASGGSGVITQRQGALYVR